MDQSTVHERITWRTCLCRERSEWCVSVHVRACKSEREREREIRWERQRVSALWTKHHRRTIYDNLLVIHLACPKPPLTRRVLIFFSLFSPDLATLETMPYYLLRSIESYLSSLSSLIHFTLFKHKRIFCKYHKRKKTDRVQPMYYLH